MRRLPWGWLGVVALTMGLLSWWLHAKLKDLKLICIAHMDPAGYLIDAPWYCGVLYQ